MSTRQIFTGPRVISAAALAREADTSRPFAGCTLDLSVTKLAPHATIDDRTHDIEELLYALAGRGHDLIDGAREDWTEGDCVIVPAGTVHEVTNASATDEAVLLRVAAGHIWRTLGVGADGRHMSDDGDRGYEPSRAWSDLRTPGTGDRPRVVRKSGTKWENTPDGLVRIITAAERTGVMPSAVDLYEQEIASMTARHWHMADELVYVVAGEGESRHWDVAADVGDRYEARIAEDASQWKLTPGDVAWVPQNTVHQHVNIGHEPLRVIVAQDRLFKMLGYDSVVYLERPRRSARAAIARSSAPSR